MKYCMILILTAAMLSNLSALPSLSQNEAPAASQVAESIQDTMVQEGQSQPEITATKLSAAEMAEVTGGEMTINCETCECNMNTGICKCNNCSIVLE